MKVLLLGGNGMIGNQLFHSWQSLFDLKITLKKPEDNYKDFNLFNQKNSFFDIDIKMLDRLERAIHIFEPNTIVNCIGVTKQKIKDKNINDVDYINGIFPHELDKICKKKLIRLIHLSTDCVFFGDKGNYTVSDHPDAKDLYGLSKIKGEVISNNSLTIRKSTIGFELYDYHGLLEWFMSQKNDVNGFSNAFFTGISTLELANILFTIIKFYPEINGIHHLSGPKIDKYNLLLKIKSTFKLTNIKINMFKDYYCDRSLIDSGLSSKISYNMPTWDKMILDLFLSSKEVN